MPRYSFDIREGGELTPDEQGLELSTLQAAQEEAARALADMALDAVRKWSNGTDHRMAIEVRDDDGPGFRSSSHSSSIGRGREDNQVRSEPRPRCDAWRRKGPRATLVRGGPGAAAGAPPFARHANNSAPAGVKVMKVPDSCIVSQPRSIASVSPAP
ncbi:DUF6894 family protein [Bradyrhizobium icense]|uniref:DUF6894 family protein n=1 Tax=Bradyrhizobium icense TaxID=1274631 RepID=UPI003AAF0100